VTRRAPTPLGLSLRSGLVGVAAVGPVAGLVCAVAAGVHGLVSSVVGLALVAVFFIVTLAAVEAANSVGPALTMPVGLTVYGTLILVLGGLLFGTTLPEHLQLPSFSWTTVAATLGWLVAQSVAVWRAKLPYVVIGQPTEDNSSDG